MDGEEVQFEGVEDASRDCFISGNEGGRDGVDNRSL